MIKQTEIGISGPELVEQKTFEVVTYYSIHEHFEWIRSHVRNDMTDHDTGRTFEETHFDDPLT